MSSEQVDSDVLQPRPGSGPGCLSSRGDRQPAPRAEAGTQTQAEVGQTAEPPGGQGPHKSPAWPSVLCLAPAKPPLPLLAYLLRRGAHYFIRPQVSCPFFSSEVTSASFSPESLPFRGRLLRILRLFLLKRYPRLGFPAGVWDRYNPVFPLTSASQSEQAHPLPSIRGPASVHVARGPVSG